MGVAELRSTSQDAPRHALWRATAIGIALALLASGCANRGLGAGVTDPEGKEPVATTPPTGGTATTPPSIGFPLGALVVRGTAVDAAFSRAMYVRLDTCMASKGFQVDGEYNTAQTPEVSDDEVRANRYMAPRTRDGVYGYLFSSTGNPDDPPTGSNRSQEEAMAYDIAMRGTPDSIQEIRLIGFDGSPIGSVTIGDGCVGDAFVEIFGSIDSYLEYVKTQALVEDIGVRSWSRLFSDPAAIEASAEWSQCMATKGFEYHVPLEVSNQDWPEPRPQAEESATALADHECRNDTAINTRLATVEGGWQLVMLEEYPELLPTLDNYHAMLVQSDPLVTSN